MTDTAAATTLRFSRLLLTGAAGGLGRVLRPRLKACCDVLRVSDIADLGDAAPGEEVQPCTLEDKAGVIALLEGVQAGAKRIVFASSNHVTGFRRQDETISPREPVRPDGYYGLSKAFGENLAQFYFDRWGIETVSLRIGSSFPEPRDRRMLATWLSYDDLERLVVSALTAPAVGHTVIYGMSDNRLTWWDNTSARHVGFRPQDSSEPFRAAVEARQQHIDLSDPAAHCQGGGFVKMGPF
ncbi:MAG: NAD(P)-dependent oxidoreductase [Rubrivivax sp.]|nr:NAD(P)-dependent oxidoreductase [Rubrivivax sp.]